MLNAIFFKTQHLPFLYLVIDYKFFRHFSPFIPSLLMEANIEVLEDLAVMEENTIKNEKLLEVLAEGIIYVMLAEKVKNSRINSGNLNKPE